jgi:hypothetical protein
MKQRAQEPAIKRPEHVSWHDHLVMLLHVGAEIEHGLMLQYLYAAWSIDVDGAPSELRPAFRSWQDSILAVAKEEMGHLVTVQNVLLLLGAPSNLGRDDFPWDTDYYPFPFCLEPLSRSSVALYLFAEMPSREELEAAPSGHRDGLYDWFARTGRARMKKLIGKRAIAGRPFHRVDDLYREIIRLISDPDLIPDASFREESYRAQARWDDWGRRYRPPPKMLTPEGGLDDQGMPTGPIALSNTNVLVAPVATRRQAIDALCALSEQGEGPHRGGDKPEEPSHFDRFLEIFRDLEGLPKGVAPALPVATNPTTRPDAAPGGTEQAARAEGYIAHPRTRRWAALANLRYRMLLTFLAHALRAAPEERRGEATLRGSLVHRTFGEMYAIKALSARLMRLPMAKGKRGGRTCAGPPFEMPYDVTLPAGEGDIWRRHLELVRGSIRLCDDLVHGAPADEAAELAAMRDLDRSTEAWLLRILDGLGLKEGDGP